MNDLIAALTIFGKYTDSSYPTHCEHDVLHVMVNADAVSEEDKKALEALSFTPDDEYGLTFKSYRFGSA